MGQDHIQHVELTNQQLRALEEQGAYLTNDTQGNRVNLVLEEE
jgi:hypothetical protein